MSRVPIFSEMFSSRFEDWSLCMGSLEHHRKPMAQGDVFSLQCSLATKAGEKGTERY